MNSFYTENELKEMGFLSIGKNVSISRKASIYGADRMRIGNNVRVDDYCILSGNIEMGNYIHVSASVLIFAGNAGVYFEDFSGISSRSAIYAVSDDYSGEYLTNPTVDDKYKNVNESKVFLRKHSLIGSGCTILPGVEVGEGTAVGSMSLVNKNLEPWSIYVGVPARRLKDRSKRLLELEQQFLKENENGR